MCEYKLLSEGGEYNNISCTQQNHKCIDLTFAPTIDPTSYPTMLSIHNLKFVFNSVFIYKNKKQQISNILSNY